ncbi:MAG: hypothetical protein COV70_03220 [Parcubacteria group bacterium CG11_big_fil_rev_8_21_14_0_20_39_22]|nr:MAG: hypothetical protein COV70_03220 [Parcubacteria group bacterium CG11_big_fil_rev_8_21_14_0_20_39_22]
MANKKAKTTTKSKSKKTNKKIKVVKGVFSKTKKKFGNKTIQLSSRKKSVSKKNNNAKKVSQKPRKKKARRQETNLKSKSRPFSKKFTRKKENFTCKYCGEKVKGDGYTNHCPKCLWSKHVDINPGDRKEKCLGLMEPSSIEIKSGNHIIVHRCETCGFVRRNKFGEKDSFDTVIEIAKRTGGIGGVA